MKQLGFGTAASKERIAAKEARRPGSEPERRKGRGRGGQPGHPGKGLARHPGSGQRKEADPPAQWRRISSALAGDPWLPAIPAAA